MNVHKICKTPSFPRQLRPSAAIFCYLPLLARLICGSVQARSAKKPLPGLAGGDGGASVQVAATGKARAAPSALATAGCNVRMILVYPIAHGKVMVMDHATVQTGSFNYSNAAARQNSENVVVNWQNAGLAAAYLAHFERNWNQGVPYETHY